MAQNKTAVAGGYLINGAFIPHAHGNLARAGKSKALTAPAVHPGMVRQTAGALHPYLHGQAVDDEVCDKLCHGTQVPVHPGMASRTARGINGDGPAHLRQASDNFNLGKMGDVKPGQLPSPATKRNAGQR